MKISETKAPLIFRSLALGISIAGIVLHMLADNVVPTGFMVRHKLAYYTIQTNLWAALLFGALLLNTLRQHRQTGRWSAGTVAPGLHGALTFYITMTMLGFWGILAPTTGIPRNSFLLLNTLILHLITPVLVILDFLLFCPHGRLRRRHAALWLAYPLGYVLFVFLYSSFIREPYYSFRLGARTIDLMYPYPFLDPAVMTPWGVAAAVILLAGVFYGVARLFVWTDRRLAAGKDKNP